MRSKGIDAIEETMRIYGLDGEDAFFTIASFYVECYTPAADKRLENIYSKGLALIEKQRISTSHSALIESVVRQDTDGHLLPIFYQHFLSKRFREMSGKFFTPQPIARAMVELLTVFDNAVVVDPTCGSGTFLKEASRKWNGSKCNLVGNDIDGFLVDLTELSLSIGVPSWHTHELFNTSIYDPDDKIRYLYETADYVIANPPFSLQINSFNSRSELFQLGYRSSDALFLDFAHQLLKPSGRLVCLLPHSIVTNYEFIKLRKAVEKYWFVLGVITLPEGVFITTAKTSSRADILVLEKKDEVDKPEKMFLSYVPSVGVPLRARAESNENQLMALVLSEDIQQLLQKRGGNS